MEDGHPKPCPRCGAAHSDFADCTYVKALEFSFDINGNKFISRVEFLTPADFAPRKVLVDDHPQPEYPRLGEK